MIILKCVYYMYNFHFDNLLLMKVIWIIKYSKFLYLGSVIGRSCADPEVGTGGPDSPGKSQVVSLEILVQTCLEKQLDPRGGLTSVKYVNE